MRLESLIETCFFEIETEAEELKNKTRIKPHVTRMSGEPIYEVPHSEFKGWGTRVLNLLARVFGEASAHYKEFSSFFSHSSGEIDQMDTCTAIFLAAKKDYRAGYLFNTRALVKAEVLDDVLDQARVLLENGYKDAACLLIGVSLEVAVKELANRSQIQFGKLDKMNVELCKANVYNMAKQKQITAWAELRNKAAHGEWNAYDSNDVQNFYNGVLGFVGDYV